jgi:CRP-like cAMP-binding protein
MAGTTRETATRALYHLQDNKIIELLGKKIKILNFKVLIHEANILD